MADEPAPQIHSTFDKQDLKRRSLRGGIATVASQGVKFGLKFGSTLVLARLLSPPEFGIVAMVAPILAFVTTLNDLGYTQAIIQHRDLSKAQISSLFWINLLMSVGLAAVLVIASPLVGWIYHEPRLPPLLLTMASLVILGTLSMIPSALLLRDMRFNQQVSVDLVGVTVSIAVTIAAAMMGFSYWSIVIGQIANAVTNLILLAILTRWRPQWPRRGVEIGHVVRFGANLTGVNIAGYFSSTADNMIIGAVAGKTPLGLYDRSFNLVVQPINQLMAPVSRVALPLLSRLREDPQLYRDTYLNMVRIGLSFTMPLMVACMVLAAPMVHFLLGPKWQAAGPILAWISFGGLVAPLTTTSGWVFATRGRTDQQLRVTLVTAALSIASFAIGVHWGAVGVAEASALSFTFLQTPLVVWGSTRDCAVRFADMAGAVWPLIVAAAAAGGALYLSLGFWQSWRLAIALGLCYLIFGAVAFLLPGGRAMYRTIIGLASSLRPGRAKAVSQP
ncbi:lipopolysaccharide biosynthesis protein [Phenylobacterium sp.]|uniref:lipopolysaccharide biosynthesis protein n=1 Tax=Phenylobacterium sp. TaxID=1871053 RepID=UPI0012258FF9|nr:lipopolysaccharide biosynthesis protein [Phenylobacterium sp.]THD63285.1 MAG: lipopolysaccharide biosynthesis protein [Phenylobacterium sp.]